MREEIEFENQHNLEDKGDGDKSDAVSSFA